MPQSIVKTPFTSKKNLTKGVVGANAREVESGDTAYISLKAEVEKVPETEQ